MRRVIAVALTSACAWCASVGGAAAYDANVAWSPVAEAAGYKVYVRQNGNPYTAGIDVGSTLPDPDGAVRQIVMALPADATNSFTVTSYDAFQNESLRSNELSIAPIGGTPTPSVIATQTPTPAPTPTPTGTPTPTATGTLPTSTPTLAATLAPTPTPTPSAGGTCGNGQLDLGEQCDGSADAACPTLCLSDCSCPRYVELPLDGWVKVSGQGTWTIRRDDPGAPGPVLVTTTTTTPSTGFAIAYPAHGSLGMQLPFLAFTAANGPGSSLEVVVRSPSGSTRVLAYAASDGVPIRWKRRAVFPVGAYASGEFRTVYRDLAADLRAAFGVSLASVDQVQLRGLVTVSRIMFADRGNVPEQTAASNSLSLPLAGWSLRGRGQAFQNEYDPTLGGPTLRSEPNDLAASTPELSYPSGSSMALIAPFRTLSFVVRDEAQFSVEITLGTADRKSTRLRYQAELTAPSIRHRRALLPLVLSAAEDSPYKLAIIDLASDLALVTPEAPISSVLRIRMRGKFRAGDIVLTDPIE